jgi:hypothetical protein
VEAAMDHQILPNTAEEAPSFTNNSTSRPNVGRMAIASALLVGSSLILLRNTNSLADSPHHHNRIDITSQPLYVQNILRSLRNGDIDISGVGGRNSNSLADGGGLVTRQKDRQQDSTVTTGSGCIDVYHLSVVPDEESTCTNSNHYPNEWNSPEVYVYLFHRTADECCESLLNGGYDECFVVNACREVTVVTTEIAALEDVSKDCLDEWHMSVEPDEEGIW